MIGGPSYSSVDRYDQTAEIISEFFERVVGPLMSQTYLGAFLLVCIAATLGFFAWRIVKEAFK